MRILFISIIFLLNSTALYGQFGTHEQKQIERIEKAEIAFKKGEYDLAISHYNDYLRNVGKYEERGKIEAKIDEIKECRKNEEAAQNLFNKKLYSDAHQLYLSLFAKSPASIELLNQVIACSKYINYEQAKIIEEISTLINIASGGNDQLSQQKDILELILNELIKQKRANLDNAEDKLRTEYQELISNLQQRIDNLQQKIDRGTTATSISNPPPEKSKRGYISYFSFLHIGTGVSWGDIGTSFSYRGKGIVGWGIEFGIGMNFVKRENATYDGRLETDHLHLSLGGKIYPFQNRRFFLTRDLFVMINYGTLSTKEFPSTNEDDGSWGLNGTRTLHGGALLVGGDWTIPCLHNPEGGIIITGGGGYSINNLRTWEFVYNIGFGLYLKL